MIAGVVIGCYAIAWLVTARLLYARNRGEWENGYGKTVGDGRMAAAAMSLALIWPLVWCAALVVFRPPPTAAERAEQEKKLKARIAELESEAGITQT